MAVILIGGGSRSGKSRYALELARKLGKRRAFLATAETYDEEMRERAQTHRRERGADFTTIEEPLAVSEAIEARWAEFDTWVVDCLTLWLSNLLLAGGRDIPEETARLLAAARIPGAVILVTNEVGSGIVPESELARRFRDLAGWMNQQAAAAAAEGYWMVFGCALFRSLAPAWGGLRRPCCWRWKRCCHRSWPRCWWWRFGWR
jgi:adenosylcobinamide kinase/adenosylcobinamide-phosphate guanylyltransferase